MDTASVGTHPEYGGTNGDQSRFFGSGLLWSQTCWEATGGTSYKMNQNILLCTSGMYWVIILWG